MAQLRQQFPMPAAQRLVLALQRFDGVGGFLHIVRAGRNVEVVQPLDQVGVVNHRVSPAPLINLTAALCKSATCSEFGIRTTSIRSRATLTTADRRRLVSASSCSNCERSGSTLSGAMSGNTDFH